MKELSIEEKARRYDEAIREFKPIYDLAKEQGRTIDVEEFERIFPELKESENEKLRKEIISAIKEDWPGHTDWIAWLEKQGEKKSADNVEPKFNFNVGQWIVATGKCTYLITKIDGFYVTLVDVNGNEYVFDTSSLEDAHLWNIKDAKDGDVLACNEGILLFKSYSVQGRISLYWLYNGQTNNFHSKEVDDTLLTTRNKICPSTKGQHDLLFQKMKESGYEWDAEKKELRKIEKFAWSEEDDQYIIDTLNLLSFGCSIHSISEVKDFLKSLKNRYTWKPSEEQITWLYRAADNASKDSRIKQVLNNLLSDLKKLK